MTVTLGTDDVERFRAVLARRLGLQFEEAHRGRLGDVLRGRADSTRRGCEAYLDHLEAERDASELGALAQELTVPETYFFRNIDQFRAFSEKVLPDRLRAKAAQQRLRILSAGCASGEEPYTVAILLRETIDPWGETSVLAVDVNPVVLGRAQRARFSMWALRETPPDVRHRWFTPGGRDEVVLDDAIRASVKFERRNLAEDDPELWEPDAYDVVFCRNVLMYFTPDSRRALVARITRALAPGGYLFIGHAETLRGLSSDFHLCHTHGTFYYRRKRHLPPGTRAPSTTADAPGTSSPPPLVSLVDHADAWVEDIRLATERVRQLLESTRARRASGTVVASTPGRHPWDLGRPLELLREERFAEALDLVETLPPEAASDPDVVLLRAVLLAHSGLLEGAEQACHRLLEIDERSAGAHYLLALCREGTGDHTGAAEHDCVAASLDPGFPMPRLHLGLLARRAGDPETARREFGQAVRLLREEDPSRLLLFGGGFSPEALMTLCRAELLAGGESW